MPNWSNWHDYLCVESVIIMMRIESNQPTKRNNAHLMLTTATGAALGMGSRYFVPTKAELKSFSTCADEFFSNASTSARSANRSMLKYGVIGAIIATGIFLASKLLNKKEEQKTPADSFEYSRLQAFIDAPEYACELLLYDD